MRCWPTRSMSMSNRLPAIIFSISGKDHAPRSDYASSRVLVGHPAAAKSARAPDVWLGNTKLSFIANNGNKAERIKRPFVMLFFLSVSCVTFSLVQNARQSIVLRNRYTSIMTCHTPDGKKGYKNQITYCLGTGASGVSFQGDLRSMRVQGCYRFWK